MNQGMKSAGVLSCRNPHRSVIFLKPLEAVIQWQLAEASVAFTFLEQLQLLLAFCCILHLSRTAMACKGNQRLECNSPPVSDQLGHAILSGLNVGHRISGCKHDFNRLFTTHR